jgi:uncharacterized phage protein (TIGR01671 family)
MNREIKFRAWDKSCDKMRGENGIKDCFSLRSDGVYNDDYILMQFTGLKDKNGKEVYEADIVIHDGEKIVVKYGIQSVDAFEGAGFNLWSFYGQKLGGFRLQSEIEIIGNIYENPELLKTNKDEK